MRSARTASLYYWVMTLGGKPLAVAAQQVTVDRSIAYPRDLPSLTSLRAFAALLVFVFHLGQWGLPFHAGYVGYVGVAFFYVLSGFVLTWGVAPNSTIRRFYVRRFARIYPSHLFVWLLVILLPLVVVPPTASQLVANGLLVQAWYPEGTLVYSMNGVAWSLSCELAFYLLFPVILRLMLKARLSLLWAVVGFLYAVANIAVVVASRTTTPDDPFFVFVSTNPAVRLPEFLIGVALAMSLRSGVRVKLWPALVIVGGSFAGLVLFSDKPAGSTWAAPVFALVIALAAQSDFTGRSLLRAPWLVYAGRISFAFYLVHQLVIVNLNRYLGGSYLNSALALAISVLLAACVHHLVELPSHKFLVGRAGVPKRNSRNDSI